MKTKMLLLAIVPVLFLLSLFPFLTSKQNVIIVSVNNSLCENVKVGEKISEVNGYIINSVKDFENALKGVKKGDYVTLVVNGGPGGCKAIEDADIGIKVKEEKGRKIVFGPEISGARVFFLRSENKTKLAKILEKRIKYLALPYTYAEIKGNYVVLTSLPEVDLSDILFIGHFEGFVRQALELENNSAKLRIGDKVHNIEIKNKRARFEYFLSDELTAGIVLSGTEIKSIRLGKVNITDAYCAFENGELFVKNMHISDYVFASYNRHEPRTERKLLLNKREIKKITIQVEEKGLTLVPKNLYINDNGLVKITLAVAQGKKLYDKREALQKKDAMRSMERKMKDY